MAIRYSAVLLVAVWALAAAAGRKTDIDIVPGPTAISAAEVAIAADPSHGVQHGVILSQETEYDETSLTGYTLTYHLRAKILSPEGRSLADVEVPVDDGDTTLKTWWGRTLLPTGEVRELKKDALIFQTAAKTSRGKNQVLKAALPGVVPGSVIDFGYTVYNEGYYRYRNVPIEQTWPVRSFRYRWVPSSQMPAAYATAHVDGKPIQVVRDRDSVLVTASNLPPVADEPYMPPEAEVRASITLFYSSDSEDANEYWNLAAKREQTKLKSFGSGGAIKDVIDQLKVPANATLDQKLSAAYDWIATNVQNSYLKTAEQEEAYKDDDDARARDTAKVVLAAKEGTGWQIDKLFLTAARALGADAQLLYATDRTERFWQIGFKSMEQFEFGFVAVRPPGARDDAWTIVDPGSGLPYGELPWRATGISGFLCLPTGKGVLQIPPSPPTKNRADTHVTVAFSNDNETRTIKWSRTGQGAAGMDWRRWLRSLDPDERKKKLDEACGGSIGSGEVVAAELPGLDDPTARFQIACDIEMEGTGLDESIGRYQIDALGPWWPETPELTAPTRTQPMIFDYPSLNIVSVDIVAPEGFAAEAPPAPVKLQSPYGSYEFWARKTDNGFHVDRAFALTPLVVRADDYENLKRFLEQVRTADRMPLPFRRSQAQP